MEENIEQNLDTEHTNQTLQYFITGEKSITYPANKHANVILVLGNSGVGKSTFVQYIAGDNSKLISKEAVYVDSDGEEHHTGDFTIEDNNQHIGSDTFVSHTKIPELTIDVKTNTYIYDCPGFQDSRNATYDMAASYFTKKIIDRAEKVKFVIVANYASVTSGADRTDFILLAKHVTNIIKNVDKFKNGICLIASKIKGDKTDEQVVDSIVVYLKRALDDLKKKLQNTTSNLEQDENIIKFIDALLLKNGINKKYTRIGFVKQPKESGPLSAIKPVQDHKKSLFKLLFNNTEFIRNDNPSADFGYTISSDSINYVNNLVHAIHQRILYHTNIIAVTVQQHYEDLLQQIANQINSFTNGTFDVNQLEAKRFVDKFRNGKNVIETFLNEINNITVDELSTKLNDSMANLDIKSNEISNHISTISNHESYLNFLQPFNNMSLPKDQLVATFHNVPTFFSTCFDRFHATAMEGSHNIHAQILRNITKIVDAIKQYYDDLVREMENKINSFVNGTIIDVNPSQSQKFMNELDAGRRISEKLKHEINDTCTIGQFLIKLNDTVDNLGIRNNGILNNISNISKLENYLNFLQPFYNSTSPAAVEWVTNFKDIPSFLSLSSERLRANATNVKNQIDNIIKDAMLNSGNSLKTYFSAQEETMHDIEKSFDEITQELRNLRNVQKALKAITVPKLCAEQIIANFATARYSDLINNAFSTISRFDNYLQYLNQFRILDQHSFKCDEGLDVVIEYIAESEKWYSFLKQLYDRLSQYEIQKESETYNTLSDVFFRQNENKTVGATGLKDFLQKCCPKLSSVTYNGIENMVLNKFKLKALQKVIDITLVDHFKNKLNEPCNSKLVMKGHLIKLSEINRKNCSTPIKSIEIFALDKVFIDTTLNKMGETIQLSIIAPKWEVVEGKQKIILDGKPGEAYAKAKNGTFHGTKGDDGKPGKPGGSAGNFIGFGETCINCKNLMISANGGKGGSGQEGGDGANGQSRPNNDNPDLKSYFDWEVAIKFPLDNHYSVDNPLTQFLERHYEIREISRKQFVYLFLVDYCLQTFDVFKIGGNGGKGGNGGRGGNGGLPGHVAISFINKENLTISNSTGENGPHGHGGSGGMPGNSSTLITLYTTIEVTLPCKTGEEMANWRAKSGKIIKFSAADTIPTGYPGRGIYEVYWTNSENNKYIAERGENGTTGANTEGIEIPELMPLANPSYTVNRYNNYLREHLIDNIRESDLRNFLSQIKHNEEMNNLYDASGFIDELYTLEDQFHQLHKKLSFLPFYKSLLERTDEFIRKSSPKMSDADKKVFNFLYTAILSRIYAINRKNDDFVISIILYLDLLSKNIDALKKDKLSIQINESKDTYIAQMNSKINEAKAFIEHDITQGIDDVITETDIKIQLLIDELIKHQNDAKKEMEKFKERESKLRNQLIMRKILGVVQISSQFLAFTGPMGAAAGAAIGGISMAVQTVADDTGSLGSDKITALPTAVGKSVSKITDQYSSTQQSLKAKLDAAKLEADEWRKEEPPKASVKKIHEEILQLKKTLEDGQGNPLDDIKSKVEELKKTIDLEKNQIEKTDAKRKSRYMKIQFAISALEIGQDTWSKIQNDEAKVEQTQNLIKAAQDKFVKLENHKQNIYKIMIPKCQEVQKIVQSLDKTLPGKSLASLDIQKWQIQNTIRDLRVQVQSMTKGFDVEEDIRNCIEKLEYGMATQIQLYDRIQQYHEHKQFADYISEITSTRVKEIPTNPQLNSEIDKLNFIIRSSYVLTESEKAMNAFLQYKFPYAYLYLDQFESLPDLSSENTTDNLVNAAIKKIDSIKTQLKKDDAVTDGHQDTYTILNVPFNGEGHHPKPFYTWKYHLNQGAISKLLQGKQITIEADIINAAIKENAVKFNEISIRFKFANETLQTAFNNELPNLSVRMIHLGNSYYRCGNKIYIITHEKQQIEHPLQKNEKGTYDMPNTIYEKIQTNRPLLSPYTLWKINLFGKTENENYNFTNLEKYLNEPIDLQLEGRGQYIKRKYTKEVCDNNLEKYYTLHRTLSDDYNYDKKQHRRRRRSIVSVDGNESLPQPLKLEHESVASLTKSSASRITSPINRAINYLRNSLGIFSFLNPNIITKGFSFITDGMQFSSISSENVAGENIKNEITSTSGNFNVNESLMLANYLMRYFTKAKSYDIHERPIDRLELNACVLNIVTKFETLLNEVANGYYPPDNSLEFDPITLITKLENKIINGNLPEVEYVLYEYVTINVPKNASNFDNVAVRGQIREMITEIL